jgi:hypothetical protein
MSKSKNPITKAATAKKKIASAKLAPNKVREGSKHDLIPGLSRRKQGATAELQKTSGWQAHSVRGFLSGTVKKRLGLTLQSAKRKDGERRYTIAAS